MSRKRKPTWHCRRARREASTIFYALSYLPCLEPIHWSCEVTWQFSKLKEQMQKKTVSLLGSSGQGSGRPTISEPVFNKYPSLYSINLRGTTFSRSSLVFQVVHITFSSLAWRAVAAPGGPLSGTPGGLLIGTPGGKPVAAEKMGGGATPPKVTVAVTRAGGSTIPPGGRIEPMRRDCHRAACKSVMTLPSTTETGLHRRWRRVNDKRRQKPTAATQARSPDSLKARCFASCSPSPKQS